MGVLLIARCLWGSWRVWSDWSDCVDGTQTRTRQISDILRGTHPCPTDLVQTDTQTQNCGMLGKALWM